ENLFQFYLARLHRPQDLQYLSDELYRIISQPIKKFRQQILDTHVADLSIAILYTALAHKLDPAQIGLVRLCVCVLQSFSVEAKFAKALNRVFVDETNLPAVARIPSFSGTFADYLIISINTLITSTRNTLASLYEPLLSILCNLSPYFMNVSIAAAHKLVQLFTIFASPAMLLTDRHHPRRLILIADALDRIVQYGFRDNPHVIYSIVRANDKIRLLKDFTLARVCQNSTTITATQRATRRPEQEQQQQQQEGQQKDEERPREMEETNVSSSSSTANASRSGNDGTPAFVPTEAWVSSWLPKVKLDQLLHMLDVVVPRVEALCSSGHLTSDHEILAEKAHLRRRPFQWNDRVAYWCRSLLWGHVYTMYRAPLGLWQGTAIQLFQVKSSNAGNTANATAAPAAAANTEQPNSASNA
ncbi:high-temperature-induced dauer-formation protein-domain-containing protein, partial [Syncephalis pseudoplumigaleata]